jgi:N-acetylglucosamine-6-phosphate deacetylase
MSVNETRLRAMHYTSGKPVELRFADGCIVECRELEEFKGDEVYADGAVATDEWPIVAPGFVDLQINGYKGSDMNGMPLQTGEVDTFVHSLWEQGVTASYPTVITGGAESIQEAVAVIASACDASPVVEASIAGIHLEGPFISPEDGARGAHALEHVRQPDWELFSRWQEASGGRIKLITLSPEWPESAAFIERCTQSGVIVSIGHTSATPEQIRAAVEAGAQLSTHFGNGAHLMLPRHPNYLWEQLAQDRLWCTVIADGFHLPLQVLQVVQRVKRERMLLVSDAVALAGMEPGAYTTPVGGEVVLTPEGRLHLAHNDKLLAGSALMLKDSIEHMLRCGLAELPEAWDMASIRPATLMGLQVAAGIAAGAPADLVLFRKGEDSSVQIEATYKSGICVYRRNPAMA